MISQHGILCPLLSTYIMENRLQLVALPICSKEPGTFRWLSGQHGSEDVASATSLEPATTLESKETSSLAVSSCEPPYE